MCSLPIPPEWMSNDLISEWRSLLRKFLYIQRGGKSDLSGLSLGVRCEMHEGIVSRAVVPLSVSWHWKIFHPYNCFLLLPEEHRPQAPSREWAIKRAYELYGIDNVQEWFYNELGWKSIAGKKRVPYRI